MKKLLTFLLFLLLLSGCAAPAPEVTGPTDPLTLAMTQKLTAKAVESLPVASENMSKDELRQLCLAYFDLQLSFQWTPSRSVTDYPVTHAKTKKTLDKGSVYGGIPYQSLGTGNLYRWLDYYDEVTGLFDIDRARAENGGDTVTSVERDKNGNVTYYRYRWMRALFNQCSVASFWGWGRVINSANFAWTSEMNVYNGFIPVGGYTYGYTHNGKYYGPETIVRFGDRDALSNPIGYDTVDVINDWKKAQGEDAMLRCYAQMLPADCLVSGGHAMMVRDVNLHYNEDGSINYRRSTVTVLEQTEGWGSESKISNIPYKVQGGYNQVYTLLYLQSKEYIPFTFAEFLEEDDPRLETFRSSVGECYTVFDAASGTGVEKAEVFSTAKNGSISYSGFQTLTVGANYPISDVFVTVTDGGGKEVHEVIHRAEDAHTREVPMSAVRASYETEGGKTLRLYDGLREFADGTHTVTVKLRLSTGQLLTAFTGKLSG